MEPGQCIVQWGLIKHNVQLKAHYKSCTTQNTVKDNTHSNIYIYISKAYTLWISECHNYYTSISFLQNKCITACVKKKKH